MHAWIEFFFVCEEEGITVTSRGTFSPLALRASRSRNVPRDLDSRYDKLPDISFLVGLNNNPSGNSVCAPAQRQRRLTCLLFASRVQLTP
jgi:hypothetical protein